MLTLPALVSSHLYWQIVSGFSWFPYYNRAWMFSFLPICHHFRALPFRNYGSANFSLLIRGKKFKNATPRKKKISTNKIWGKESKLLEINPSNTFGFNLTCENAPEAVLFQSLLEVFAEVHWSTLAEHKHSFQSNKKNLYILKIYWIATLMFLSLILHIIKEMAVKGRHGMF